MTKVRFQIKGPIKIGKGQPIPELARKVIEDNLGFGPSKESKEADAKKEAE